MFTGIEITDKGVADDGRYVAAVREQVGMDVPLSADHFGHIGVNSLHPARQGAARSTTWRGWKT